MSEYVVSYKTIIKYIDIVKQLKHLYTAMMSKEATKTKRDYFWLLRSEFNAFHTFHKSYAFNGCADDETLNKELPHFWGRIVLRHAEVHGKLKTDRNHSLKTILVL